MTDRRDAVEPTKQQRIKAEKARLHRVLRDIDGARLVAVDGLIGVVAFMAVELEDLQQALLEHGIVVENRTNPETRAYLDLAQRYLPAVQQLLDMLPSAPPELS